MVNSEKKQKDGFGLPSSNVRKKDNTLLENARKVDKIAKWNAEFPDPQKIRDETLELVAAKDAEEIMNKKRLEQEKKTAALAEKKRIAEEKLKAKQEEDARKKAAEELKQAQIQEAKEAKERELAEKKRIAEEKKRAQIAEKKEQLEKLKAQKQAELDALETADPEEMIEE